MAHLLRACFFPAVCLSLSLLAGSSVWSDQTDDDLEKGREALAAFDRTVMKIESGICRITGETVSPGRDTAVPDDILLIFDYPSGNYRCDDGGIAKILFNPDYFYEIRNPDDFSDSSVRRAPLSDSENSPPSSRTVDIQNVFQYVPVGPSKPFDYQNSQFHTTVHELAVDSYEELDNGMVKVTTAAPLSDGSRIVREFYLDTLHSFSVVHMNVKHGDDTNYLFDISWDTINDTAIPVSYSMKSLNRIPFSVDWKIEWEKVNEAVPPEFFDIDKMVSDLKNGAVLLKNEAGTAPAISGRIEKGEPAGEGVFSRDIRQPRAFPWAKCLTVGIGLVLILWSVAWKIIKSVRSGKQT
ncbi:MAG: hypothetical protein IJG60_04250 [Thermoguttaceae bacterium]|nr:hypothetical protein [Thermoguttaceae bacterium]